MNVDLNVNTFSNSNDQNFDYEDLSEKLIEELNIVRKDPSSYVEILQQTIKYFRGDILYKPRETAVQTCEGKTAFEEAIEFLKRQKPLSALINEVRISKACRDHVDDIGPKGLAQHESSDGRNVSDRIETYCEWDGACSENIDFGTKKVQDLVLNFIVDDGIPERLQRKNLFNPEFQFVGVASGPHREYEIVTVVNFATAIRNHGENAPESKNFIHEYLKKEEERKQNPKKEKNAFQQDDPDAPDDTIFVKLVKVTKVVKGKPKKFTRKIYQLADGTQHIVEMEDAWMA